MPGGQPGSPGLPPTAPSRIASWLADLVEHGVGQHLAGGEVALGAEVVAGLLELHPAARRLEDLERLGGHLGPDAVAADHGHPDRAWSCERGVGSDVMGVRLVVVRALAAVVPQVERGLHGLVAVRVLGLVVGRDPTSGYMSYTELLLVFIGSSLVIGGRRAAAWRSRRIRSWVSRTRVRSSGCGSREKRGLVRIRRGAARRVDLTGPGRNAEHRGEVASSVRPAAALDKYEHAPHDVTTVRRAPAAAAAGYRRAAHHARRRIPG